MHNERAREKGITQLCIFGYKVGWTTSQFVCFFFSIPFPTQKHTRRQSRGQENMATNFFFQHPTSFLHQGRPLRIQFRSSPTNLYKLVTLYFYLYTIQNVHSHQVHILNPQRNVAVSVYTPPTATLALMIDIVRLLLDLMTNCCRIERFCRHRSSLKIAAL